MSGLSSAQGSCDGATTGLLPLPPRPQHPPYDRSAAVFRRFRDLFSPPGGGASSDVQHPTQVRFGRRLRSSHTRGTQPLKSRLSSPTAFGAGRTDSSAVVLFAATFSRSALSLPARQNTPTGRKPHCLTAKVSIDSARAAPLATATANFIAQPNRALCNLTSHRHCSPRQKSRNETNRHGVLAICTRTAAAPMPRRAPRSQARTRPRRTHAKNKYGSYARHTIREANDVQSPYATTATPTYQNFTGKSTRDLSYRNCIYLISLQ